MRSRLIGGNIVLFLLTGLLLAACNTSEPQPPATATPQVIVKRLATLGPTHTPDPINATSIIQPTAAGNLPTVPVSPTPYIGVFLGEAEVGEINAPFLLPTRDISPTPRSVLDRFNCAIDAGTVFGTVWATDSRALNDLRCPIQETFGFVGRVQVFEGGAIYWRTETGEFWLIAPGSIAEDGQFWKVDQPTEIPLPNLPPVTEGLIIPEGPMKDAWLTITDARAALGYGLTPELEIQVNLQRFEGGTLFADLTTGQVFALLANGDVIGPLAIN